MHTRREAAIGGLAALVFCLAVSAGAAAADFVRVTAARGPIRTEASATAGLIATVAKGTLLEVVAKTGEWYRVLLPPDKQGTRLAGFILASLVTLEPASAPVTPSGAGKPPAPGAKPAPGAPKKPSRYTLRGFGAVEYESFQAKDSFDAIFGNSGGLPYGGGVELSIGPSLFVQGRVSHLSKTGQRAFVHNGEVSRLGIEQTVTMTPIDVTAGYRFAAQPRFTPYATGGIGALIYREASASDDTADNVSGTFASFHVGGGVEVLIVKKWLSIAGEFQYRSVPGALGDDGVSKEFGETNLGGMSLCVKLLIGRQPPRKVRPPKPVTPPLKAPAPKRQGIE